MCQCDGPSGLSIQQLAVVWVLAPEELRIAERHVDAVPAGVKDDGSAGPCAAANDISMRPERADLASWPLHSLPDAEAGESRKSAWYIEEHDNHGN